MKHSSVLWALFCFWVHLGAWAADHFPKITSPIALVIDADTGGVLYAKNEHVKAYPASLTKIATVLYVLKHKSHWLDRSLSGPKEALQIYTPYEKRAMGQGLPPWVLETDGTGIALRPMEKMKLDDLLTAMMVCSANDAANTVASMEGSIEEFMQKLNGFLQEIGCTNTQFTNPHGLHDDGHYSTAHDLAKIAQHALKVSGFTDYTTKTAFLRPQTNFQKPRVIRAGNRLIKKGRYYYPKAIGLKTGYTSKAGFCLVAAATDGKKRYIATILGAKDRLIRYQEATALLEAAFHAKEVTTTVLSTGMLSDTVALKGASRQVQGYLKQDLALRLKRGEQLNYTTEVQIAPASYPIAKNQVIGQVVVANDLGEPLAVEAIYSAYDIQEAWGHWISRISSNVYNKLAAHTNRAAVGICALLALFYALKLLVYWRVRRP